MIKLIDPADALDGIFDLEQLVCKTFQKEGELCRVLGFEHRPQQEQMAGEVLEAIESGEHLIFEAGTGVGKSLAYLIPAILQAKQNSRPCIIATNTINLQEQLLHKDIPAVQELFSESTDLQPFHDFRCALLVGRGNYLCTTRLRKALLGQGELFESRERNELQRIAKWADSQAKEGIRQELSPPPLSNVWDAINADSSMCSSKRCNSDHCFYRRARAQVEKAHVIIVNHSLLFSLLGAGVSPSNEADGVIFPHDFVIFDEAHEMIDEASEHLGISISSWALESSLRRVYNPAKRKGLLKKVGRLSDFDSVESGIHAVSDFFNHLHTANLGQKDRVRLLEPNQLPMDILPPLSKVARGLIELGENCEDEALKIELLDQAKRLQGYIHSLSDIIELKSKDCVYWMERTGKQKQIIHLRSAPLDVSGILKEELFRKNSPVIMTSATLTHNGEPERFVESSGCDTGRKTIVQSPFDYDFNMNIRVFEDCPEPMSEDRSKYLDYLVRALDSLAGSMEGGTLALFTNYQDLNYCYQHLKSAWQKKQRSVYAQGIDYSRSELRNRMMEEGDVLLLGAESFWKGFDAKGPALSQVILTRLPFENPNHPLMEAKSEKLANEGKRAFFELTLPNAITRFRQGVGRLIRSKTDIGELVILDSRVLKKTYGKLFLAELPKKNFERDCLMSDSLEDIDVA